ncbi:FliM/FliN family flagellar motor switch protein [Chromobacterium vaccinii]|uniref:FliM/FliN family flagellar motor switch protein n=1 Tax=Chromobacterium vaccinii TaxID=1108595 RepID=UPI001E5C2998|nr:FliM/FliN family flagellar motor switch protein [Chromobacterium vaccinii]MCD4483207.1 FliM/FliN family flagellar motor switch protein [Chromobacterium vaccinii]MCD4501052.1 FliM/FliN family flagellar motor switch protein [Chromobacterium vaccinii]
MSKEVEIFNPPQLDGKTEAGAAGLLQGRMELLKEVQVQLETRIGRCRLSIAELDALKEGEVLALDKAPSDAVEILLGGQVVARGSLVVAGDHFGVRIEQVAQLSA